MYLIKIIANYGLSTEGKASHLLWSEIYQSLQVNFESLRVYLLLGAQLKVTAVLDVLISSQNSKHLDWRYICF